MALRDPGRTARLAVVLLAAVLAISAGCGADERPQNAAPAPSTTASDRPRAEAAVVCDGHGTRTTSARVRAQGDGVHIRVDNTSRTRLGWSAEAGDGGLGPGMGLDAPVGVSEHVLPLPPGTLHVACDGADGRPSGRPGVAIDVVDPDGVWTDISLDRCDGFTVFADYTADAKGLPGDPVDVVRERLRRHDAVRPGDRLQRAGYRDAGAPALVRLVREERTIALFSLMGAGAGGWLLSQTDACSGEGLD